jgi:glycosyltransferase involved in cell wall biosynthesis
MKIALVNNLYGETKRGGAEALAELQAELLRRAGHQVVIVTTRPWGSKLPKVEDGYYRLGGFAGLFYHLGKLPLFARFLWQVEELLNLWRPWRLAMQLALSGCKLVVCHNLTGISIWLPRMAKNFQMDSILVLHDVQYLHPSGLMYVKQERKLDTFFAVAYQSLVRYALKPVRLVISPSHWLAEFYLTKKIFSEQNMLELPNPVLKVADQLGNKISNNRLVFVGQLELHKGVIELVEAFKNLKIDSGLDIIGTGSLLARLKNMVKDDPRIVLHGRLTKEQYSKKVEQSCALVVPSLCYENQPTVALEAFTRGVPVLASNFGGTAELLAGGAGLIFNPLNKIDIGEKLSAVLNMTEAERQLMTTIAKAKISSFTIDFYEKKFLHIINQFSNH